MGNGDGQTAERVDSPAACGRRLRAARLALGMEQSAFASRAGIPYNTYNNYESGVSRPRVDFALALRNIYGITLDWIYCGDASSLPARLIDAMVEQRRADGN